MDDRLVGGRYRLLDARALGGSAAVWRAIDEQTGEAVAVKLLHPHLVADDGARERLAREGAALGAIDHPNVVGVRAVVDDASGPAIVMDFVDGRSLAERLEDGALDEGEAGAIALDVTEALRAVHAVGLVHRDVKPGNILLGSDGRTRLVDFGIAADTITDATALTAADGVIGTLRYLAPERLAGDTATAATDVWGVGAVLYEMLAGTPAYPSSTVLERAESAHRDLPRPDRVSDAVWSVMERSLAADPADRFRDADSLAEALRDAVGSRATVAPALADPWAATRTIPLGTSGATIADAVVAGTAAGSVATAAPARAALLGRTATGRSFAQPAGPWRPIAIGLGVLVLAVAVISAGSVDRGGVDAADRPSTEPSASVTPALPTPTVTPAVVSGEDGDRADDADDKAPGRDKPKERGNDDGRGRGNGNDKDD